MNQVIENGNDFISCFAAIERSFKNTVVSSKVPDVCKTEPCVLGVDEAGRGPVLGPMVYGISFCPISAKEKFSSLGCDDSKALTEKKREDLFSILCACDDYVGWIVDVITPNYISNCMLHKSKCSLNEIAENSTVGLIRQALANGALVEEIYVDTVGPPEKYQNKLSKHFPQCKITVAKKADSLYPIVSAASICAKVVRDRIISNWSFPETIELSNNNYGSGYPNDPKTQSFLTSCFDGLFGFPNLVRFSWSTAEKILVKDGIDVEWEEEEGSNLKISNCFALSQKKHQMSHSFFKDNRLFNLNNFV